MVTENSSVRHGCQTSDFTSDTQLIPGQKQKSEITPNNCNATQRNVSKSIVVHHNRKANIIQSFGRYTDVTSYEDNIDDKPIRIGVLPEKIEDFYKLEDSYDSLVPNARAAQ